jgi:ATP/maltotriose-dependent transcriptional regulator MalT
LAAGQVNKLAHLAEELRAESPNPLTRARAGHYLAYALAQSMRQATAQDMLQRSLSELIDLDDAAGWASLTTLASLTYQTCDRHDTLVYWLGRYEALTPSGLAGTPLNAAARAWIHVALDPLARPREIRALLREAPATPEGSWPSRLIASYDMLLGATAWLLDEHRVALTRLRRASDRLRRSGSHEQLVQTTMALGQVQFDMGQYDEAESAGRLMVDIGEATVLVYYQSVGRELRARVAAVRGDHRQALHDAENLLASIEVGEAVALEANLYVTRAYALFGLHDYEGAYQQLRALFDVTGRPIHPHVSYRALGDLTSAAVRLGRTDEVIHLVRAAEEQIADLPGDRMTRVVCRAKALIADDEEAGALYERSVQEPRASLWPMEQANAQLEYGVWLRRQHRAADARHQLRSARQTFARLGAVAWAQAAEAELRAAGVHLDDPDRRTSRWSDLTSQEREIVVLAAKGMTNRRIGETLFLSPRTVGAHLYHAFPKLGVTSRTQLRDIVEQLHAPADLT